MNTIGTIYQISDTFLTSRKIFYAQSNGINYFKISQEIKKLEFYREETPFWNDFVMQNTYRKVVLGAINLLLGLWPTYHENIGGQFWT